MVKNPDNVKRGKKARLSGAEFERRTRKDLEEKGWIVDKFGNNVEFTDVSILDADIMSESEFNLRRSLHNKTAQTESDLNYLSKDVKYISEKKIEGKLIQAKPKMVFNPMIKRMVPQQTNSGFPDFVAFRRIRIIDDAKFERFSLTKKGIEPEMEIKKSHYEYEVIGVESKMTGVLDKIEKEKCKWLLDNGIFSKILVARKTKVKNRIVVEYEDFTEIEKRMK